MAVTEIAIVSAASDLLGLTGGSDSSKEAAERYYRCENDRREKAWTSSLLVAGLGLATTYKYHNEYSDVVDRRKDLNDRIYACALKEHEFWRDRTYPHALAIYDWVTSVPEITPDYTGQRDRPPVERMYQAASQGHTGCDRCDDAGVELRANQALAEINAMTALAANDERRAEYRREFKSSGLAALDRAGKNVDAPGRQYMGIGLNLINTLVAMTSTGLNSGMNMLGRGVAGMATNNDVAGGRSSP